MVATARPSVLPPSWPPSSALYPLATLSALPRAHFRRWGRSRPFHDMLSPPSRWCSQQRCAGRALPRGRLTAGATAAAVAAAPPIQTSGVGVGDGGGAGAAGRRGGGARGVGRGGGKAPPFPLRRPLPVRRGGGEGIDGRGGAGKPAGNGGAGEARGGSKRALPSNRPRPHPLSAVRCERYHPPAGRGDAQGPIMATDTPTICQSTAFSRKVGVAARTTTVQGPPRPGRGPLLAAAAASSGGNLPLTACHPPSPAAGASAVMTRCAAHRGQRTQRTQRKTEEKKKQGHVEHAPRPPSPPPRSRGEAQPPPRPPPLPRWP